MILIIWVRRLQFTNQINECVFLPIYIILVMTANKREISKNI